MRSLSLAVIGLLLLGGPGRAEPKTPAAPASGSLTVAGTKYSLASALAYNTKVGGKTRTVIYLTEKPLDTAKLKQSLQKDGTDRGFSVIAPHVQLIFDETGTLFQTVLYAEGRTINEIGSDDIKGSVKSADGKAAGKGSTTKPIKAFGESFEFDVTFDVQLTVP